jgi:hypothetical protein
MGMLEDEITEVKRMGHRDEKIRKLSAALQAMVDRWEPDCGGQDRVMWENAVEALEFASNENCPICYSGGFSDIEGCDHTVTERTAAALARS